MNRINIDEIKRLSPLNYLFLNTTETWNKLLQGCSHKWGYLGFLLYPSFEIKIINLFTLKVPEWSNQNLKTLIKQGYFEEISIQEINPNLKVNVNLLDSVKSDHSLSSRVFNLNQFNEAYLVLHSITEIYPKPWEGIKLQINFFKKQISTSYDMQIYQKLVADIYSDIIPKVDNNSMFELISLILTSLESGNLNPYFLKNILHKISQTYGFQIPIIDQELWKQEITVSRDIISINHKHQNNIKCIKYSSKPDEIITSVFEQLKLDLNSNEIPKLNFGILIKNLNCALNLDLPKLPHGSFILLGNSNKIEKLKYGNILNSHLFNEDFIIPSINFDLTSLNLKQLLNIELALSNLENHNFDNLRTEVTKRISRLKVLKITNQ